MKEGDADTAPISALQRQQVFLPQTAMQIAGLKQVYGFRALAPGPEASVGEYDWRLLMSRSFDAIAPQVLAPHTAMQMAGLEQVYAADACSDTITTPSIIAGCRSFTKDLIITRSLR